jgi:hypothetical protein
LSGRQSSSSWLTISRHFFVVAAKTEENNTGMVMHRIMILQSFIFIKTDDLSKSYIL